MRATNRQKGKNREAPDRRRPNDAAVGSVRRPPNTVRTWPSLRWLEDHFRLCAMSVIDDFMVYAAAFEQTYADDDWSRLEKFFAGDAVYEVESSAFGCKLHGPKSIFAGIKKSLDGFDRRMESRTIELTSEPKTTENSFEVSWKVTYTKPGAPPFELRGHSRAKYENGKIVELVDSYSPEMDLESREWVSKHAPDLAVSYV